VKEGERDEMAKNTINPMSLDPLGWHLMLILIAMAGGYFATNFLNSRFPGVGFPMMSIAMIAGVIMHFILKALNLNQYVDKRVITRIGSSSTDYLVVFGVAAIRITVVVDFAGPIILMSALALLYCLWYLFFVCRRLYKKFWFERGIFVYGWSCGVVATGVTLLRIVDPEFRSKTLEDYGTSYVVIGIIEVFLVALTPVLVMAGQGYVGGAVLIAISVAILLVCSRIYGTNKCKMNEICPGEEEVLNKK
jgi:ESS family glutamate:Na+ symporter